MAEDSPHQVFCSLQDLGAWQALGECPCAAEMINKALSLVPSHPASAPDLRGSGTVHITSASKVLAPSPGLLLRRSCRQDWCLQPLSGVVQRAPVLR